MKNQLSRIALNNSDSHFKYSRNNAMRDLATKIVQISELSVPVVIIGEYGSGRHKTARLIHQLSKGKNAPFNRFASEDFHKMLCDSAQNDFLFNGIKYKNFESIKSLLRGTLFIENFHELSTHDRYLLINILNRLQIADINSISPFGENRNSIRIILTVDHKNYKLIRDNAIWHYLMEKLNPVIFFQPPLREHLEDISFLVDEFLHQFREENKQWSEVSISPRALYKCISFHWPGNISQLKNAINHAAVISDGSFILPEHLPFSVNNSVNHQPGHNKEVSQSFQFAEKQLLWDMLDKYRSKYRVADYLGIDIQLFCKKLKKYEIKACL